MIKKVIQYLVDSTGQYLSLPVEEIVANENNTTRLQLVCPFPLENSASVHFTMFDSLNKDLKQYLIPSNKKGGQVVDKDNPFYQQVSDWNVFEIDISQKALSYISKYRAGRVGVSFKVVERVPNIDATNYVGLFGVDKPLPQYANFGDYVVCDTFNYLLDGNLYNKGDILYYTEFWRHGGVLEKINTETEELSVSGSLSVPQPEYDENEIGLALAEMMSLISHKQDINDDALETETKTVPGAINEVNRKSNTAFLNSASALQKAEEAKEIADGLNDKVEESLENSVEAKTKSEEAFSKASIAEENANDAKNIALGKVKSETFQTYDDLILYISNSENIGKHKRGDIFWIVETGVPDYWISYDLVEPNEKGWFYEIEEFESEIPDISNMVTTDTNQNIIGSKNFLGGLKKDGVDVATLSDIEDFEKKIIYTSKYIPIIESTINYAYEGEDPADVEIQVDVGTDSLENLPLIVFFAMKISKDELSNMLMDSTLTREQLKLVSNLRRICQIEGGESQPLILGCELNHDSRYNILTVSFADNSRLLNGNLMKLWYNLEDEGNTFAFIDVDNSIGLPNENSLGGIPLLIPKTDSDDKEVSMDENGKLYYSDNIKRINNREPDEQKSVTITGSDIKITVGSEESIPDVVAQQEIDFDHKLEEKIGTINGVSPVSGNDSVEIDGADIKVDKEFSTTIKQKLSNIDSRQSDDESNLNTHTSNINNPHNVTKSQIGLGNVDNTSDENKPISEATQLALNSLDSKINTISGLGGDLQAYDFGKAIPTQEELSDYALTQISGISEIDEIFNNTKVKNLFDGNVWRLTNTPTTIPPIFEWTNIGSDFIAPAENDAYGTVKGNENVSMSNGLLTVLKSKNSDKLGDKLPSEYASQTDIETLSGIVEEKVDKEDGKGLSENDLTDVLKENYNVAFNIAKQISDSWIATTTKTICVSKLNGNNTTGDGSFAKPFNTIGKAITEVGTPTGNIRVLIKVLDSSNYNEPSITIPSNVYIDMGGATFIGAVVMNDRTLFKAYRHFPHIGSISMVSSNGLAIYDVQISDGRGLNPDTPLSNVRNISNGGAGSILHASCFFMFTGAGGSACIRDLSTGFGHIHLTAEDVYLASDAFAIDAQSDNAYIIGNIGHIIRFGSATNTTAFKLLNQVTQRIIINVKEVVSDTSMNLTGVASTTTGLFLDCPKIEGVRIGESPAFEPVKKSIVDDIKERMVTTDTEQTITGVKNFHFNTKFSINSDNTDFRLPLTTPRISSSEKRYLLGIAQNGANYTTTHSDVFMQDGKIHANLSGEAELCAKLKGTDTRKNPDWGEEGNSQPAPNVYYKYSIGFLSEFIKMATVGVSGATYGLLLTNIPWSDSTGGRPSQVLYSPTGTMYVRQAASETTWGAWSEIIKSSGNQSFTDSKTFEKGLKIGSWTVTESSDGSLSFYK